MSTVEKLSLQIFDRKRQITQQLNHQKQLYEQNLASKLLIQGITPPTWLLNSDRFASYSVPSSDPTELNKEELISGLLLPGPQSVPYYCNATHLYSQPPSTVVNGYLQHDLLNNTDAGDKGLDDCRTGPSHQNLIRDLEDVHHVAESPQERVADPDQSLVGMQRSKSRQKALELRSSIKASIKCHLEETPASGPRRHDASNEECATTSGEVLITSIDICLQKKQDVSSKEEGEFQLIADETDVPNNMMSPTSHCLDVPVEESLIAAQSIPSKEGMPMHLLKESIVVSHESSDGKHANADLFKDELIDSQCVSREEDTCSPKPKCDNTQNISDAERLVAVELPENIIDQLCRPASLGVPPSNFHASNHSDRKMDVRNSTPVGILKQTNLTDTLVLTGISDELLAGGSNAIATNLTDTSVLSGISDELLPGGCNAIATDAPTNLLSLHSDHEDFPVEESVVAVESVSSKGGIPAPFGVWQHSQMGVTPAQSDVTGQISEGDFRNTAIEKGAPTDLMSPNSYSRDLYIEKSLVAENSVSSKGGLCRHLPKESTDMDGSFDRKCANSDLLTEDLIRKNEVLPKAEDTCFCHNKELEASSDLLSPEKHPEIDTPTNLMSPNNGCQDLYVEESPVAEQSASSKEGISRRLLKESVDKDGYCDRKSANFNLLTQDLRENEALSQPENISLFHTKDLGALTDLLSPQKHIAQPELEQSNSPSSERVNHGSNAFEKDKFLEEAAAEGTLVDNLLHVVQGEGLKSSSVELNSEIDLENQCGLSSGKDSRESQRRYDGSTDQCKPAEWSGATANEPTSSNSEDSMKHASVRPKQELSCAHSQAAADKFIISPKLLELQTLGAVSSSTSFVGGSWPQQKRRKTESVISRSASPHLRVKLSGIFSSELYVAKPLTDDVSATRIFQSDTSSLGILPGHSSMRQLKEEKIGSQGSTDVDSEKLQVDNVSCLTQKLTATPQECLHRDDRSIENCDFSFSISNADGDPADNEICLEENSSEVHNIDNCLSGPSFVEHEEAVGAEGGTPDLEFFTFDKNLQNVHGDIDADMDDKVDEIEEDILDSSPTALSLQKVNQFICLGDSLSEDGDSVGRKSSVADLVNFTFYSKCEDNDDPEKLVAIDLPKKAIDRAEFLERLCRSASLGLSFSDLHASYSSGMKEDLCHSVPAGVLEQTDSRCISPVNDSTVQLLKARHTYTKNEENSVFQEISFSNYTPTHGTPFPWNSKGPYTSPSERSRSSSIHCSSNPELTCFPIEESAEEDVSADDSDDNCPDETGLVGKSSCSASEENMNDVALDPASEMLSLGSFSTETSIGASTKQGSSSPEITCIPEEEESSKQHVDVVATQACQETIDSARKPLCDISKQGKESFSGTSTRREVNRKISEAEAYRSGCLRKRKVTQNTSFGTTAKKHFESRPTRFSKSKASLKSGLETRGGSLSAKEAKPNNIVSSIKSFLPIVQQQQAASRAPVKKEVKVKALEAAEAAKRLAEKKENERNQRRKRKDAEIAERKRKREEEEEEKKEKEKKRKRNAEARKQKNGHGDKILGEKQERKSQSEDGKTDTRREDDAGTEKMVAGGGLQDFQAIVAGCSTPTPDASSQTICEKSYDISPYCCSDEEDEEDDLPNHKFMPTWASKSSIKTALVSLVTVDADVIFPPSSFCSLNEALLPRELKQR